MPEHLNRVLELSKKAWIQVYLADQPVKGFLHVFEAVIGRPQVATINLSPQQMRELAAHLLEAADVLEKTP